MEQYDENGIQVEWSIDDDTDLTESHERDFWTEDDEKEEEDYFL